MKHSLLVFLGFIWSFACAQVNISFEAEEGYQLGSIHTQNDWEVTESSDGMILNQIITNEYASDGSLSFKNAHEADYGPQWFPIFGANLNPFFDNPITANSAFTISYDIMVTGHQGSDFEFTLYGINMNNEYVPIAGVGIENRGFIYLIKDENYGFEYANATWNPMEWMNVKIELTSTEIKYFINNELDTTISRFNQIGIVGFNMLHNNYGHDAFYDNISYSSDNMSLDEVDAFNTIRVYPNPVVDHVYLSGYKDQPQYVEVYNMVGKKLLYFDKVDSGFNLSELPSGIYLIKVKLVNGAILNKKIIKR